MDYLITFTGHIDPNMRGPLLPDKVFDILYIASDQESGAVSAANDRLGQYVRLQGMAISINPNGVQTLLTERRWIPMNRISHIDITVKLAHPQPPPPGSKAPETGWTA